MVTQQRRKNWEDNFDIIEKDFDRACQWWHKNKSCDCDSEEKGEWCEHFDKLLGKTMGKRILESWKELTSMQDEQLEDMEKLVKHNAK